MSNRVPLGGNLALSRIERSTSRGTATEVER